MRRVDVICDRCGKVIADKSATRGDGFDVIRAQNPRYSIYEINWTPYTTGSIDLCGNCQAELCEWIHGAKEDGK